MSESAPQPKQPDKKTRPFGGWMFSDTFMDNAPIGDAVKKLVDWLSDNMPLAARERAEKIGKEESEARMAAKVLGRYMLEKKREFKDNAPTIDTRPLNAKIQTADFDASVDEFAKNPLWREGRLSAMEQMIDLDMVLSCERKALDYLIKQAKTLIINAHALA